MADLQELENEVIQTAIAAHCHREDSNAQESHHEAVSALIEARYQSIRLKSAILDHVRETGK